VNKKVASGPIYAESERLEKYRQFMRSRCPDCGMMIGHEDEPWEITMERHIDCPSFHADSQEILLWVV